MWFMTNSDMASSMVKIIFLKLISSVRYFNPPEIVIRYYHIPFKITIRRYDSVTI